MENLDNLTKKDLLKEKLLSYFIEYLMEILLYFLLLLKEKEL